MHTSFAGTQLHEDYVNSAVVVCEHESAVMMYDEDYGLGLELAELGFLHVCVKQYAERSTGAGAYVEHAQVFDGRTLMTVVVPPNMWIGVDIYHTLGSYSWVKGRDIPYEWVLVDSQGKTWQSDAAQWLSTWAIFEVWESTAPERILLNAAQPTQQWELRQRDANRTLLVVKCVLAS